MSGRAGRYMLEALASFRLPSTHLVQRAGRVARPKGGILNRDNACLFVPEKGKDAQYVLHNFSCCAPAKCRKKRK